MSEIILSVLEEIDPRIVWQHEALEFTPWLSENLKILGAAIGLQMELVKAEMPVGRFAADILARNSLDDSLVLRLTKERSDFPSLAAAFHCILKMRRRLRGKENRVGSKRWGVALRVRPV